MTSFIFLAAGMFALGCDDYIFAGLLPGISSSLHSTIAGAAQGISVYGITYVGALPLCLFLLTKKPAQQVLLVALITFIAGNLITLLSTSLIVYLIGRAIAGIGAGLYLPLAVASFVELAPPTAQGRALSLAWGSNAAGAVIGIPIGLWLAAKTGWRVSVGMILILSVAALIGLMSRHLNLKVLALPSLRDQAKLLVDHDVMSVIGVTLLTATGGLGLYVFTSAVLSESLTSAATALSLWNVGGLIGSLVIGFIIDRLKKPQRVMAKILATLIVTFLLIPVTRAIPVLGLFPFLIWGAMGWSTMTPQQKRLNQLKANQGAALVALNSSAVSLGSVFGAALGGLAIARGFNAKNLPYAATGFLLCAFVWQVRLTLRQLGPEV